MGTIVKSNNIIPECYMLTKDCLELHRKIDSLENKVNELFIMRNSQVRDEILKSTKDIKNQISRLLGDNYPMERTSDEVDQEQQTRKKMGGIGYLWNPWKWNGEINSVIRGQEGVNQSKKAKIESIALCVTLVTLGIFATIMACILSPILLIPSVFFIAGGEINGLSAKLFGSSSEQKIICNQMEDLKTSEKTLKQSYNNLKTVLPEIAKRCAEAQNLTTDERHLNKARIEDLEFYLTHNL